MAKNLNYFTNKKNKGFTKVENEFLNNPLLGSHEKLLFILCKQYQNAPYGCRVSHKYLKRLTGIKSTSTLIKYLDRLSDFGYLGYRQPKKNESNQYTFDIKEILEFKRHNKNKRKLIKKGIKQKHTINLIKEGFNSGKVIKLGRGEA